MIAAALVFLPLPSECPSMESSDELARALKRAGVFIQRDERGNILYAGAGLTDDALALLAKTGTAHELDCTGTKVSDAGMIHLKAMKSLKVLRLSRSIITGRGLAALKDCP